MTERCCRELVHWIFVYWIVLGIPSCAPSSSQVTEDNDKASRIVSDILDIWKWSFFWDQKLLFFPEDGSALDSSNYSVGKKIQPLAFWHDPIIGMCSQELDVCAVYVKGLKDTLHQITVAHKLRGGDLNAVAVDFLSKLFVPQLASGAFVAVRPGGPPYAAMAALEKQLRASFRNSKETIDSRDFRFAATSIVLPELTSPSQIQLREKPGDIDDLIRDVRDGLRNVPTEGQCAPAQVHVPPHSKLEPFTFVYVRDADCHEAVISFSRDYNGTWWYSWPYTQDNPGAVTNDPDAFFGLRKLITDNEILKFSL